MGSETGWRTNARVWVPPMPPWNEISSSNAQPSSSSGVVEAVHHDVGDVREAVGPAQVVRRVRGEAGERVLSLDAAVGEVVRAVRAEGDRPVLGGADEEEAHVRMGAQLGDQPRMALVQLLEGEPAPLLHQVDQAEVAGAEHDHVLVADVVLRLLLRLLAPVASPTAFCAIVSFSSPPLIGLTVAESTERRTSSSSP